MKAKQLPVVLAFLAAGVCLNGSGAKQQAAAAPPVVEFVKGIVSPVDGVASIATAQIGDFLNPPGEPLTTISAVNPILVNFAASEQEHLNAMKQAAILGGDEHAVLNKLEWQLRLSDGSVYPHEGHF